MAQTRMETSATREPRKATGRVLALALVSFSTTIVLAKDLSSPDFDQGVSADKVVENLDIKKMAPLHPTFLPFGKLKEPAFGSRRVKAAAGNAYQLSDFHGQFISQTASSFQEAQSLWRDSRYSNLPSHVLSPLNATWTDVNGSRDAILADTKNLDDRDLGLKNESEGIRSTLENLDDRKKQLASDMQGWNRDCSGSQLPPDAYNACMTRRNKLEAARGQINGEIAQVNQRMTSFNGKLKKMKGDVDAWSDKATVWLGKLVDFVKKARSALKTGGAKLPPPGQCVLLEVERNSDGKAYMCKAWCNRNGGFVEYTYRPLFGGAKPCGVEIDEFFDDPGIGAGVLTQ